MAVQYNFGEVFLQSLFQAIDREDKKKQRQEDLDYRQSEVDFRNRQATQAQANADRAYNLDVAQMKEASAEREYNRKRLDKQDARLQAEYERKLEEDRIDAKEAAAYNPFLRSILGKDIDATGMSASTLENILKIANQQSNMSMNNMAKQVQMENLISIRADRERKNLEYQMQAELQGFANTLMAPTNLLATDYESSKSRLGPQATIAPGLMRGSGKPIQVTGSTGGRAELVSKSAQEMNKALLADYGTKTRIGLSQLMAKMEARTSEFNKKYQQYGIYATPITASPLFGQMEYGINTWLDAVGKGNTVNFKDFLIQSEQAKQLQYEKAKKDLDTQAKIEVERAKKAEKG